MRRSIAGKNCGAGRLLLLVLLAGLCGCGKAATVAGKVTYQGRPVIHGAVTFLSADKTARSAAIGPDGSYTIEHVPPGVVKIGVISRDPSRGRTAVAGQTAVRRQNRGRSARPPMPGWFPLPVQFEDPGTSGLSCEVGSGQVHHDIDLK